MRRYVDLAAFAVVLMGVLAMGPQPSLSATMLHATEEEDWFKKCCKNDDGSVKCCYRSGCQITPEGCIKAEASS